MRVLRRDNRARSEREVEWGCHRAGGCGAGAGLCSWSLPGGKGLSEDGDVCACMARVWRALARGVQSQRRLKKKVVEVHLSLHVAALRGVLIQEMDANPGGEC